MRILVVIYEFPPVGGGGGRAAQDISKVLAARGHEIRILTAQYKDLPAQENLDGIQVTRVKSARRQAYRAGLAPMSGYVAAGLWAGLRNIRAWQPDIIHVHFAVPSGPVAWVLSKFTKTPYVLTAHLGDVPNGVPEKTAVWFRWVYPFTPPIWRNASQVVAVSNYTRQLAQRYYPVDIQVVPNGADIEKLDPGVFRVNRPPRVIFAGRFMAQKQPRQVVETLAELRHMDWDCVMLGDGPLLPEIKSQIQQLGLQGRFTLPGWVTPEVVIDWLRQSDILFMPSTSEGLPIVGVQSLAMGLGLVVSKVGGLPDLIDPAQNGYLVDLDQPGEFKERLEELLCNPELLQTFRENSRRKAAQFDIRNIALAYEKIFEQVLRQHRGSSNAQDQSLK